MYLTYNYMLGVGFSPPAMGFSPVGHSPVAEKTMNNLYHNSP